MCRISLPLSSIILQGRTREKGSKTTKFAGRLEGLPASTRRQRQRHGKWSAVAQQHHDHYPTVESGIPRLNSKGQHTECFSRQILVQHRSERNKDGIDGRRSSTSQKVNRAHKVSDDGEVKLSRGLHIEVVENFIKPFTTM